MRSTQLPPTARQSMHEGISTTQLRTKAVLDGDHPGRQRPRKWFMTGAADARLHHGRGLSESLWVRQ